MMKYKKNQMVVCDGFVVKLIKPLGEGYWLVKFTPFGHDKWHEDEFELDKGEEYYNDL